MDFRTPMAWPTMIVLMNPSALSHILVIKLSWYSHFRLATPWAKYNCCWGDLTSTRKPSKSRSAGTNRNAPSGRLDLHLTSPGLPSLLCTGCFAFSGSSRAVPMSDHVGSRVSTIPSRTRRGYTQGDYLRLVVVLSAFI